MIGEEALADAILDRLVQRAYKRKVNGKYL